MNQINTTSIKVLFTCLLLSFTVQCCAAATVSIGDITADPGEVVTVPIRIDDIEDCGAATIKLEYDSSVIFVEDVTGSSDSTTVTKNIYNPDPGQAETEGTEGYAIISALNVNGVSGNIVFDVTIKAVGNSGGSTTLTLTVDTLQDTSYNEIPVDISSGSFTITGQASADPAPTHVPQTPSANDGGASTSQTPQDDGTGTNPTSSPQSDGAVQPAPHDAGTDSSPPTHPSGEDEAHSTPQPAATSMVKKPSSAMPGFEGVLLVIGLLTAYLIARRDYR